MDSQPPLWIWLGRAKRVSHCHWSSDRRPGFASQMAKQCFPCQRSFKVKCLLNFLNTAWLWTLRLLHWPVKTPQWKGSHYPDKATEQIELQGPLDAAARSFCNPSPICLTFACFSLFFFVEFHLYDHFTPTILPNSQSTIRSLPHHSQELSFWWISHVSLKFLTQKSEEHWLKCLGKMNLGRTQQNKVNVRKRQRRGGEKRNGLEVEKQDLLK